MHQEVALLTAQQPYAQSVLGAMEPDWITSRIYSRQAAAEIGEQTIGHGSEVCEDQAAGMQPLNHPDPREMSDEPGGLGVMPSGRRISLYYGIAIFKSTQTHSSGAEPFRREGISEFDEATHHVLVERTERLR